MFKRLALVLAACLMLTPAPRAQAAPLRVTATFYPLYVAALNIVQGVDAIQLECLAPPQAGCLHEYQMTTADRRLLADSDLVIGNGAGLEAFLEPLLPTLTGRWLDSSAGIPLLAEEDDHGHGSHNPHVWVSLWGMMAQVRTIADGLAALDPANAALYAANAAAYIEKLSALDGEMRAALAPYAGTPIITFHEAFAYFAEDFDLRVVATLQHESGDAPSAHRLAEVIAIARAEGVHALFAEPQYEDASVEIIARETGLPIYLLDPAVSEPADPADPDGYLRVMRQNLATLTEALR
ncbi:MAG: metal ABC transporter substrate-binding protein [Oscillospiraceae bacterium]|nr:metal ABC transporter substrate-binding protein [Oscillospiraceae bacterium]